ncbi:MAG: transglutaminase family protein [Albidovulum sp.]|nr:transglutaminase family protein [Albidovulum sp.]MDE0306385.1 transglutaminase family protein [Albidovulum sp.]
MILNIRHETAYEFSEPMPYGLFELRKTPSVNSVQVSHDWSIDISGGEIEAQFNDCHRNAVNLVSVDKNGRSLRIIASGTVDARDSAGIIGPDNGGPPPAYYLRGTRLTLAGDGIQGIVSKLGNASTSSISAMHDLTNTVREAIAYEIGWTDTGTTAEEALESGSGVCQDHAHVFLAAARKLGIPARYASGYLFVQEQPEQEASHAWAEAFLDGIGWTGFDVANGISPDDRYVRLSVGLDFSDAAPVRGIGLGIRNSSISERLWVEKIGA